MKAMEAVRNIMERKAVRPSDLAFGLKIKNATLSERFTQKNVSVAKLDEMLRFLGYKIVVLPREARIPEGGIEIE